MTVITSASCHSKHQRRRKFARIKKGADHFSAFLKQQATKLGITQAVLFTDLKRNTATQIRSATTTGQLR